MNSDLGYIKGMRQIAAAIVEHARGHSQDSLEADRKTRSAVLYEIVIIGEGVKRLSPEFKVRNPGVPWKQIAGMRDRVVHSFDEVDLRLVWNVVEVHVPRLLVDLAAIEAREQETNP
jgi:uncharacterized protein with HEPN domain